MRRLAAIVCLLCAVFGAGEAGAATTRVSAREVLSCSARLGSLAVGAPNRGALSASVRLRDNAGLRMLAGSRREAAWGTEELVAGIVSAVETFHRRFPSAPAVVVGDLSKRRGGRFGNHASHQNGRDVDIGYPVLRGGLGAFVNETAATIDADRTWGLIDAFRRSGWLEHVFTDRSFVPALKRAALRAGVSEDEVETLFTSVVKHEPWHKSHMHLRLAARTSVCGESGPGLAARQSPAADVPGDTAPSAQLGGGTIGRMKRLVGIDGRLGAL